MLTLPRGIFPVMAFFVRLFAVKVESQSAKLRQEISIVNIPEPDSENSPKFRAGLLLAKVLRGRITT